MCGIELRDAGIEAFGFIDGRRHCLLKLGFRLQGSSCEVVTVGFYGFLCPCGPFPYLAFITLLQALQVGLLGQKVGAGETAGGPSGSRSPRFDDARPRRLRGLPATQEQGDNSKHPDRHAYGKQSCSITTNEVSPR